MGKPRQRQQKSGLIVHTKMNWLRELVISIFSLVVWSYCALVVIFFITAIFDYHDPYSSLIKMSFKMTNSDIRAFLFIILFIWAIFYLVLWGWKIYNKKRFGSLNRRTYPANATKEDLLSLQFMSEKDYDSLQQSNVIIFEKNPIKEI
ncbi:poly-beta-1,6-N-acetyl-D-glucosamine biosynthesis protein PgaD [Metabacillus sp. Hm71]|uniref:poly-beta-1,6-N-acetyl-D-glucosamine biosynthesis protein PgaD n=1 Tax=Metabacillus sp. Hm71 TaxID=3450743 RepID=UPI003F42B432